MLSKIWTLAIPWTQGKVHLLMKIMWYDWKLQRLREWFVEIQCEISNSSDGSKNPFLTSVNRNRIHAHAWVKYIRLKPPKTTGMGPFKFPIKIFQCFWVHPVYTGCPWGGPAWDTKGQVVWTWGERETHSYCPSSLQCDGQHITRSSAPLKTVDGTWQSHTHTPRRVYSTHGNLLYVTSLSNSDPPDRKISLPLSSSNIFRCHFHQKF